MIVTNWTETKDRDARFALNYLIDRKLIVNELMGGYGSQIISYYGPTDPEYLTIIKELESFNFKYNPALANKIISKSMTDRGVEKIDGKWISERTLWNGLLISYPLSKA